MPRRLWIIPLLIVFSAANALAAVATEGHWILYQVLPTGDSVICLMKVDKQGDQLRAESLFAPTGVELTIQQFKRENGQISFTISQTRTVQGRSIDSVQTFEGALGADDKVVLGSLGQDRFANRAKLERTEKTTLERTELFVRKEPVDSFQKAQQLNAKASSLMMQWQREQDAEKKKELQEQMTAARKEAADQVPSLYREVVSQHPDRPEALDAAQYLLRTASTAKVTPEEAGKLLKIVDQLSAPHGQRFHRLQVVQMAQLLANQPGMESAVLSVVEPLVKTMKADEKPSMQVSLLSLYRKALSKSDRKEEMKALDDRLAILEGELDKEYLATVPPFKPAAFAGRTNKSANRVAVLELFTGAQCPPCVAADVAFDALEKAYPEKDLVLIQYHMHIPGPDPMTNPDCIARWDYYRQSFGQQIRGTPSTLFNGRPEAGGGGGMTAAENKYKQYTGIIDPLLEKETPLRIQGEAKRAGDQLEIHVALSGAEPDADQVRLRLFVVEEAVRYVGSNQLRFHHHVVRAMPGGAQGEVVKDKSLKHSAKLDLNQLRHKLNQYLDDYAANTRPFPSDARPLDFNHLKVIAIVQHDGTKEILQAAYLPIQGQSKKADH